ncbi:hypothetical protein GCM10010455_10560 [Microbacterium esteraromaticum]
MHHIHPRTVSKQFDRPQPLQHMRLHDCGSIPFRLSHVNSFPGRWRISITRRFPTPSAGADGPIGCPALFGSESAGMPVSRVFQRQLIVGKEVPMSSVDAEPFVALLWNAVQV